MKGLFLYFLRNNERIKSADMPNKKSVSLEKETLLQ